MAPRHNCERCWTQDPDAPTVKKFDEWLCPTHLDDLEEEVRVLMAEAAIEFGAWRLERLRAGRALRDQWAADAFVETETHRAEQARISRLNWLRRLGWALRDAALAAEAGLEPLA